MDIKQQAKRLAPLIASLIGAVLIIFALYAKGRISEAKGTVHGIGSHMSSNPFGRLVSGEMEREASQYDKTVKWCLIGGIILLIGGCTVYYYRRHRY
jgi:hypothetical protein